MTAKTYSNISVIDVDYDTYSIDVAKLRDQFLEYPRKISIETQVNCNAACQFCPYPTSPRQGQTMKSELFHKIIEDLTSIPLHHKFDITLHRINEPLLDKRMKVFCQKIAEHLPNANQQFFTNGTMLTEGKFEWINQFQGASLQVSLNSINEEEHQRLMGFGLKKVSKGLDYLQKLVESKEFSLPVILRAPFQNQQQSKNFERTCRDRWPSLKPVVRPYYQWMGGSNAGSEYIDDFGLPTKNIEQVKLFSCGQWFDLHILANGYITKCCIDENGYIGKNMFDVNNNHVLNIYAISRYLRENLPKRTNVKSCNECLFLG